MPTVLKIFILAIVQGTCELLPVSSSAHVIIAERLMGLDPTTPRMTFLLVMLHTGTMFACIVYFWETWRSRYFSSLPAFLAFARSAALATVCTGVVGLGLKVLIEKVVLRGGPHAEVEQLFGNLTLIAAALAGVGLLIVISGLRSARGADKAPGPQGAGREPQGTVPAADALWIGVVQGLCLPFRGFSRSGATISTGLLRGLDRQVLENYSFALAVILTPAVIVLEGHRLLQEQHGGGAAGAEWLSWLWPSLAGMGLSFAAGWLALKWLSRWLEHGRWHLFGYYCWAAAAAVLLIARFVAPVPAQAAVPVSAQASAQTTAGVVVSDAWSRPTPPAAGAAAGDLTIDNRRPRPARRIGVPTPVAAEAQIHETLSVDGAMRMREVDGLEMAPGATVRIAPGGMHVMLSGLRAPLEAGATFPLTLRFREAGARTVTVTVRAGGNE